MDVVDLPLMWIDTFLKDALQSMATRNRSAVVAIEDSSKGRQFWLFTAGNVYKGLARKKQKLSELRRDCPVFRPTAQIVAQTGIDLVEPNKTWQQIEQLLDENDALYSITGPVGSETAIIVTRHESLKAKAGASPKDCYCSGPQEHEFPPPPVSSGDACPYCGHKVYCKY